MRSAQTDSPAPDVHQYDIIVLGSGPCGSMAAMATVSAGADVLMVDWGDDDAGMRAAVPDMPFSVARRTDPDQANYLIGPALEGVPTKGVKVGAQLTPPRQFINRSTDSNLPIESDSFQPMQSLAVGGLAAGWGAACFTYDDAELLRIGLDPIEIVTGYEEIIAHIGVSGPQVSDGVESPWWSRVKGHQPPLELDSNAETLLRGYEQSQNRFQQRGLRLGRIPLAVLSQQLGDRESNPYFDLDFFGDSRRSVFRPRYIVDALKLRPNFTYRNACLAVRFEEQNGCTTLHCTTPSGPQSFKGRRLILCGGAINSARLALRSWRSPPPRTTILCNAYTYIPAVNMRMFGRAARDRRYSLAQLHAWLQDGNDPTDTSSVQIYSYRSLLMFKLVKEMPLPPWLGLQCARTLANSLIIFGAFFADQQSNTKILDILPGAEDRPSPLKIDYRRLPSEIDRRVRLERKLRHHLWRLGCIPLSQIDPGAAGSIHYAGTIPFSNPIDGRFVTQPDYRLGSFENVYVGDSSSWNWLPSKGLTFTAMASATRIARRVVGTL